MSQTQLMRHVPVSHTLSLLHDFMQYTLRQAFCTMLHASDTFTATHKHSTSCLIRLLFLSLSRLGSQGRTLWINVPGFTGWPFCCPTNSVKALNWTQSSDFNDAKSPTGLILSWSTDHWFQWWQITHWTDPFLIHWPLTSMMPNLPLDSSFLDPLTTDFNDGKSPTGLILSWSAKER